MSATAEQLQTGPTVIDACHDPAMFGALFEDGESWRPWFAFLRAFYGLELDDTDLALFRKHTGRQRPAPGGYREACVITGRQSGKTRIASTVAAYEVAQAVLSSQRGVYVPLVAQDLRGAQRALYGYLREAIERSPALSPEVTRQTTTEIELSGVTAGVYPCRPAAVRGIRAACAVVDELGFFVATDGRPTDAEMLHSIRPALATTNGRLLILSSPYGQAGALYELHRKHYGQDSSTLVWQATAPEMNPGLPADYLERMRESDPEAYRSEVLGEFRAGISTFIDPDALAEVVETGVREHPPQDGITYHAYIDAASGSGKDSFAAGIAHKDGEHVVLDVIRRWQPPFNPSGVIAEACDLLKRYRISEAQGDKYAPGFVNEGFRKHNVSYKPSPRTTSEVYLELLPLVNAGSVSILDEPRLLRELRGLERRRGTAGRDKVDHRRGEHDDSAVACAGALVSVATFKPRPKSRTVYLKYL
ncbi:MAG: hypothetical protein RQ826_14960 [Xanthomonadales bacterium]|nr:hypothetical protein [Xanthomonadales bacterium]